MSSRRNAARRARHKGGFTMVEVVVAMAVMVFGIMAIVGLQSHTVQINSLARQMSIANQIAQTWLERMKQDAHRWTRVTNVQLGTPTPIEILSETTWLQQVNVMPGRFQSVPATGAASGAYDFQGNELLLGAAGTPFFCTSFKLGWVYVGRTVRADVRVFWPRERANAIVGCVDNDAPLNPGGALVNSFHIVYLSTVIKHTRVER
jgi:prepilin-type N-terminal cleavage/methylation domain-containing protein